jgi:hypothetical protein
LNDKVRSCFNDSRLKKKTPLKFEMKSQMTILWLEINTHCQQKRKFVTCKIRGIFVLCRVCLVVVIGSRRALWERLVLCLYLRFVQIWIFFLLKLSAVCTFWIVLMCWCQKWFLKNKKKSLACISTRKAIWKTPATTLPNTLYVYQEQVKT